MNYLKIGFKILLIVFLSELLISCISAPDRSYVTYEFVNRSDGTIKIEFASLEGFGSPLLNEIIILSDEIYVSQKFDTSRGNVGFSSIFKCDEVIIKFKQEKAITYSARNNSTDLRNLFNSNSYEIINSDNNSILRYTFTVADYEAAVPIDD